jgi:hypothetical protein
MMGGRHGWFLAVNCKFLFHKQGGKNRKIEKYGFFFPSSATKSKICPFFTPFPSPHFEQILTRNL